MTDQVDPARILVVDDEPLNLDVLEQELEDRGHDIDLAEDGNEALEKVAADPPDLILLDVIMPGLDGIEVCRRLKADPATAHIPIIIMTALNDVEDRVRGIEAGADDFLSKPVDDRELMARIGTALRAKRAGDRTRAELEGATDRLRVLGRLDRDVSIVIVNDVALEAEAVVADAGDARLGIIDRPDGSHAIVVLTPDPIDHALAAARIAAGAAARGARVGADAGTALVRSFPTSEPDTDSWMDSVEGAAYDAAESLLRLAHPGQAVLGMELIERAAGRVISSELGGSEAWLLERVMPVSDEADEPPLELAWPGEFDTVLGPMRAAWGVDGPIYLTRKLSGKSGARVFAVDITSTGFSGLAILKLDRSRNPAWDENAEAERHKRAFEAAPTFAAAHLPRIVHSFVDSDKAAVLSTVAGRGLEYVVPWAQDTYERQRRSARVISREILAQWNDDHRLSPPIRPPELLKGWLRHRLDPASLRARPYLDRIGFDLDEPTFFFDGHWYPNPYAFANDLVALPSRVALRAAEGRIHGDLHGFNALLRTDTDELDYYLIDLAYYADDTFLLFDNAYLELSYMIHTREAAHADRWMRLVGASLGHGQSDGDDLGLAQLIDAVRSGVRDWVEEREPNRLGYMESQYALARVAVGLNFANKRISDHVRLLALLYAASNLKAYLRLHEIDWPTRGAALATDGG